MKLKTRLIIAFFVILFVPFLMFGIAIFGFSKYQMQAIEQIDSTLGIGNLPVNLYEVARARIDNPEASLAELAEILGGNLTRVAVSLRLKKLIQIAKDLGENDG